MKDNEKDFEIDPRFLMAVERSTTALLGLSISLIVLGFVVEKFELFLHLLTYELKDKPINNLFKNIEFYKYLGMFIIGIGIATAFYSYYYYIKWVENLKNRTIETDKKIYLYLSVVVALIGLIMLLSMLSL
ncbi:YidH family protein [Sulfurihydrogenibium sp.]|uniref:YidH family protein n=1 Tax=Sulfurihydrogenibium sp. TaxID=2053621 RepID=UPI003D11FD91